MHRSVFRRDLGSLALAALLLCGCERASSAPPPGPPPDEAWLTAGQLAAAHLQVAATGDEDVGGAVTTSGRVTFDDLRVAHVFSPVTGRVVSIAAQPGDRVKKGATLATVESPDVGNAFSDLAKANADLAADEHDYQRQKQLFEAHAASQKDYESALGAWEKSKAEVARAQKKANLLARGGNHEGSGVTQEYRLPSPIEGEVISRAVSPGMEVVGQYSQGSAIELYTIGELDRVWVMADVFQADIGKVHTGAHVTVRVVSYRDRIFSGVVDWVSGQLDPNTHTAKVRVAIDNRDRALKPEMYASAAISVAGQRTLAIPRSALVRLGDQTMVFVQAEPSADGRSRFVRRPVAVDEDEGGDFLPVTHGLDRGEKIVVSGASTLASMM